MSQRRVNETSLTATADALRVKLGTSDPITWVENEGFKEAVESIQTDSGGADVSGVTATETEVLENAIFVDDHGEYKEGTIPRNGDTSATFDGIETKSVEIPAGYTTGGTVALDGTIDNAVEAAKTSLVNKGVDVPTDTDVRGLAGLIDIIPEAGGGSSGPFAVVEAHVGKGSHGTIAEGVVNLVVGAEAYEEPTAWYLYNGVRLPKISDTVAQRFPYAYILDDTTNDYYYLYVSQVPWYVSGGKIYRSAEGYGYRFRIPYSEVQTTSFWDGYGIVTTTSLTVTEGAPIIWANYDIPNGSADSTDIYLEASEPVMTE